MSLDDYALRAEFQRQVYEWWSNDEHLQRVAHDMTAAGVEERWRLRQYYLNPSCQAAQIVGGAQYHRPGGAEKGETCCPKPEHH